MPEPILRGGVYLLDGRPLDRVTTVLGVIAKPSLEAWRRRVGMEEAERVSRDAADWGTAVHKAVELGITTGTYGDPGADDKRAAVAAVAEWVAQNSDAIIQSEVRVWHARHGYAGTADMVMDYDTEAGPRRALLDLKTSSQIDHLYRLQTAAYVSALTEMGYPVDARWILHVTRARPDRLAVVDLEADPEGGIPHMHRDVLAWQAALRLYRWQKRLTEPKQKAEIRWLRTSQSR